MTQQILDEHFRYLTDRVRLEAYERALAAVVRPGSVVVDLGCGTGVLGFLACRAGARRVYAVDRSGMIEVARSLARENGFADRIVHVRQWSRDVSLPEPADVVVADQMGPLGFDAGLAGDFADAATRLLAPGGQLVPRELVTWVAPAESPAAWHSVDRWRAGAAGLRLEALCRKASNTWLMVRPAAGVRLLADGAPAIAFDLRQPTAAVRRARLTWTVQHAGTLHGLSCWFVATLSPGVAITNGPSPGAKLSRPAGFLPLDPAPPVREGDEIRAEVIAGIDRPSLVWRVGVLRGGVQLFESEHASLRGELLSSEDLGLYETAEARQ